MFMQFCGFIMIYSASICKGVHESKTWSDFTTEVDQCETVENKLYYNQFANRMHHFKINVFWPSHAFLFYRSE